MMDNFRSKLPVSNDQSFPVHVRPHTAHGTSSPWMGGENTMLGEYSEHQFTADTSLGIHGATRQSKVHGSPRTELSDCSPTGASFSALLLNAPEKCAVNEGFMIAAQMEKGCGSDPRSARASRRSLFERTPSCISVLSSSSATSLATSMTPGKAASLGRKFSRKYHDKIADLKENIQRHTTSMPSRIRRASTLHETSAVSSPNNTTAVSPSKRTGKHSDCRPKKMRPGLSLTTGYRKDTPAPAPLSKLPAGPAQPAPNNDSSSSWTVGGGDGARKAVALYKAAMVSSCGDMWSDVGDLDSRRARIGSLSSAADSGADLSTFGEAQHLGVRSDIEMNELDSPEKMSVHSARNFLSLLPREICLQIFEYLDAATLLRTEAVSQAWRSLCTETSVWRMAFFAQFERRIFTDPPPIQVGGVGVGRPNRPQQEWKRMYRARTILESNWRQGVQKAGKAIYLSGHTDSVYCVQFDEEKIITGSRDRTIRVWDINTFQCMRVIGGPTTKPVLGPKVLRTVDYPAFHIATASVNGTSYGDSIFHVPSQWHDASILCLQYDETILVTGSSDSDLLVWDIETYEPIKKLHRHTGGVLDVALDARHIVSCSKDSRIIVWDRRTLEARGDLTGHRGPVNAVQLRGKFLVSASGDGIARLWDVEQMKLIKEFSAKERGLAAVEFSEDMRYVLAGGNDHITYKFETDTGREVQQFTGHTQLVRSLWLDSPNNRVVSGSYDLDLRVYDFATGQELWRAEEWTTSWMLAAKSDYRRIVATSQDGRILLVDFGLQKGGRHDGEKIDDLELLRGTEHSTAIVWRNPWVT